LEESHDRIESFRKFILTRVLVSLERHLASSRLDLLRNAKFFFSKAPR
jgi:hypothetical protein